MTRQGLTWHQHALESSMGRELVSCQVTSQQKTFVIGTTHLESLPEYANTRYTQLQDCCHELQTIAGCNGTAYLMGDLNVLSGELIARDTRWKGLDGNRIGHAASGRSMCKTCETKIEKNMVRMSTEGTSNGRNIEQWHHLACFFARMEKENWTMPIQLIPGYDSLTQEGKV